MCKYSVIIPTYDSVDTLSRLLDSLSAQTCRDFEVIVVDDASTDATPDMMKGRPVRYDRLDRNSGPACARNRGAALAGGNWLVFTDADTEFFPETLEILDRVIAACPEADALVGSYAGHPANGGFVPRYKALWEYCTIDLLLHPDARGVERYTTWAPRPGAIRRSVFESIGGFNAGFRGADLEDLELGYRLVEAGHGVFIAPSVRIRHHYPATARRELRAFARRAAIWMRMGAVRHKFDSHGESSPRSAVAHMAGFGAFWGFACGLLRPPFSVVGVAGLGYFLFANRLFLGEARREEGIVFGIRCAAYCWVHSVVLGFAAIYGLLTPHRRV